MNDKRVVCDCGERRRVEEGGPKTVAVGAASVTVVPEDEIVYPSPAEILDPTRPFRERVAELEARLLVADLAEVDLKGDVADLEAEVAAREARCAVVWGALAAYFAEHDAFYAIPGQAGIFSPSLRLADDMRDAFAVPDLAAARLLAAGALAEAVRAAEDADAAWNADEGNTDREGRYYAAQAACIKASVAYRAAKAAEEKADEPA